MCTLRLNNVTFGTLNVSDETPFYLKSLSLAPYNSMSQLESPVTLDQIVVPMHYIT